MKAMSRRKFLEMLGAMGVVTILPSGTGAQTAGLGTLKEGYAFFTTPESAFVEAAVSRLIPKDELGPGALEAGVSYFIDQQLAGTFGTGAKTYRQGPWGESIPEQGYQLPLSPQEVYRLGITLTNQYCKKKYGKTFDGLSMQEQDEVLKGLDSGTVSLGELPAKTFFGMLYDNTMEGFFADPIYGGNRDKVGWKLVGFPGVAASYAGLIEEYNKPYDVEPVGIADVLQGQASLDDHGHVVHKPRKIEERS
ncbi:MAG TPA: gluconate 2-dehydrogenase subunit 3 family protein [Nitrospirota bacterium]|nr:gluconate 2-dehydrogenase subunit 3 family protein [Nitrospirota bacterium]